MPSPIRLPLGIGISALNNLVAGVLLVPFGLALASLVGAFCVWAGDVSDLTIGLFVATLAMTGAGVGALRRAWLERPTDVVFEEQGLRLDGGDMHGLVIPWAEIDPTRCAAVPLSGKKKSGVQGIALHVAVGKKTEPFAIAMAEDPGEIMSLRELLRAIVARTAPVGAQAPPQGEATSAVLACSACGAPVSPSEADHVPCPRCGASVAMAADVRARVEAVLALPRAEERAERLVRRLLDQPGARSTAATLALSLLFIAGAWPIAAVTGAILWSSHTLGPGQVLALAVLPLLLIADGFFLSRLRLVDRHALATLTSGFGARPPARPGEPASCRSCGAPLRVVDAAVVRCVFCNVVSLTSVDWRASARRASGAATSLEASLSERQAERRRWMVRTLASLPLFVATWALLRALW
ncbi:MAG TPA: hypothetical protein VIF09_22480 [Polyangiaceae bacterium]